MYILFTSKHLITSDAEYITGSKGKKRIPKAYAIATDIESPIGPVNMTPKRSKIASSRSTTTVVKWNRGSCLTADDCILLRVPAFLTGA
jgi:hypothetical protein